MSYLPIATYLLELWNKVLLNKNCNNKAIWWPVSFYILVPKAQGSSASTAMKECSFYLFRRIQVEVFEREREEDKRGEWQKWVGERESSNDKMSSHCHGEMNKGCYWTILKFPHIYTGAEGKCFQMGVFHFCFWKELKINDTTPKPAQAPKKATLCTQKEPVSTNLSCQRHLFKAQFSQSWV